MSPQMLAPQPYAVLSVPAVPLPWAPFCSPGTQYQPQSQMQVTSKSSMPKPMMSERPEDDFDGSTPALSTRVWQGSPLPSSCSDLSPSVASTDYCPSQAGDNRFPVHAQMFFPTAPMDRRNSVHNPGVREPQEQESTVIIRNIPARYTPDVLLA